MTAIATDLAHLPGTVRCHGNFYTTGTIEIAPPNMSVDGVGLDHLQNADAVAAAPAGCDIHLAQVAINERGSAEFGGYDAPRHSRNRHEDEDDQGLEVGEVFEHDATVPGRRHPDGSAPPIGELPLEEDELPARRAQRCRYRCRRAVFLRSHR